MKILFGMDVTENRKNNNINGREFITASTPAEELDAYDRSSEQLRKISEDADIPLILEIVKALAAFSGIMTLLWVMINSIKMGIAEAFYFAPYVFIICPAAWITYFAVCTLQKNRFQKVSDDPKTKAVLISAEKTNRELYNGLGVPDDALDTDVLSFCYVIKNGKPVMRERGLAAYVNLIMRVYTTKTHLCLADVSDLYCIPLDEIKGIRTENEKVLSISGWNKDENFTEGKYKKYNIIENNVGQICIRGCCAVEFEHNGEKWEIWFPSYEEETVRELLKDCILS